MDGAPPPEEDFSSLPVAERLAHKNWKARVSGYDTLIKTFQTTASDTDPAFKPYINNSDLLKKIVMDSNAVAQEKAVECLVALVKFAGETAAKTREAVVPALVDKCFGSARAGTRNQALELTLQYVEVENSGAGVVNDILLGLNAKQPKTVVGCVHAMKEIVRLFGTQVTPPAPILKALPKVFAHTDKTVRAEGFAMTHVFYRYIGAAIEPWLADLKPVQVKELKEAFENMDKDGHGKGSLKPEKMTREQGREAEARGNDAVAADEDIEAEDLAPPDARLMAEAVDIVPKLPPSLQANLSSSKWKERKEALDDLLVVLNSTPRIKEAPELGEIAKSLATRIQSDANVNCVIVAANCMEALAKGMMDAFGRYRETVVGLMLERLKERKVNVTDAIGSALDAVFSITTLPDIIPDILPALSSKNPQVKEGTLKFFNRCLSSSTLPVQPAQIKVVSEPLAALLEDSFEGARNEAATCLGTLMKMVGERPLNALMESLADVRKVKVKEAYEKATVKCKAGSGAPSKSAPSAPQAPQPKKPAALKKTQTQEKDAGLRSKSTDGDIPLSADEPAKPPSKPPARLTKKAPSASAASAPPAPKKAPPLAASSAASRPAKGSTATPSASSLDSFKYKHTPEDADALAAEMIPSSILTDFGDANWKVRLAALEEMSSWVQGALGELDAEVVIRAFARKGWSEKNFQVSAKLYSILVLLAEAPSFGRSCVALCVPHLSEKLGDVKLKKPAGDTMLLFAEKTSLQFVFNQAYEPLSKQKAPKVLADAITWIETAVTDFGIAGLSLKALIDFLKNGLGNSNAAVRTSATKALVKVKLFAGSSIKDLLEDVNSQLLNTILAEFDKVEGMPAPEPNRQSADLANVMFSTNGPGKGSGASDPLDDLFPRVEIDSLLKGTTILSDAKSDAWKPRKEALEALQALLDQGANKRLKPHMGEMAQVLKARVTDSNKAVQLLALDIVSRIATGMGRPFEKQTRFFALPVATVLADQKAPVRAAAVSTLTSIATACEGLESMVHGITTALESSNPLLRASLFTWIVDWLKEHDPPRSLDINSWAAPVVSSLDDRNGDVRKAAQALLPTLITLAGHDYVMQQTNSLKPASKSTAIPLIQAARTTASHSKPDEGPVVLKASTTYVAQPCSAPDTESASPPPASPTSPSAPSSKVAPSTKLAGVRRKLPQGTASRPESRAEAIGDTASSKLPGKSTLGGLKRPGTSSIVKVGASPTSKPAPSLPIFGTNPDARKARLGKDVQKWINEAGPTRKDLAEALQSQMEPHISKELLGLLFSHDHNAVNDHVSGLTIMCDFFSSTAADHDADGPAEELRAICLANFDLPLKYVSVKAHEPQSNLISKCLDTVDAVISFIRSAEYQLTDAEATCFIPSFIYKLGDAREPVRARVQLLIQTLPKIYAYSRIFHLLMEHGLRSKVAKTRQGALDEMAGILKRSGVGACDPAKAFPVIALMIADKDSQVRKSALNTLSEGYSLVGEKIWSLVGTMSPKDKTQLEERLRRVAGPAEPDRTEGPLPPQVTRLFTGIPRPGSPATLRTGSYSRPASPMVAGQSRLARPASPARTTMSSQSTPPTAPPLSPTRSSKLPAPSTLPMAGHPASTSNIGRPKSMLPSKLGPPPNKTIQIPIQSKLPSHGREKSKGSFTNGMHSSASTHAARLPQETYDEPQSPLQQDPDDITITISSILSSDPSRSVDALKKVQKILALSPEEGPSSAAYRDVAEHTEGLMETITLQMAHVFDNPNELVRDENWRLAKHLIQTLNTFCDHGLLAESLTVDILTSLLEELTLRLLETDDSPVSKVKELSRFINMIILRLFSKGRRMSIFRALFALLLQTVKPFPANGTMPEDKEARVAELVLKCVWKLARNIPDDLSKQALDPVELFPTVEHFLQSVPPNEWRARATNKVPCGDMPLRTIKVIIQHVVAYYGDDVYDLLSASFDDPSATIVYPYVYRIFNASSKNNAVSLEARHDTAQEESRPLSVASSRPISPHSSSATSAHYRRSSPSHQTSPSASSANGIGLYPPNAEEPDPDAQLLIIINHISSETTGAMHKEGITELHQFLKAYPHKRAKVEKMLESTGPAFRKYINRALASRAAEDEERSLAVADTLSKLESNNRDMMPNSPTQTDPSPHSPRRVESTDAQDKLSRLHDIFHYRASTTSNGSAHSHTTQAASTSRRAES